MDKVYFTVNGDNYALSGSEVSPNTSLNDYLRYYLQLHGTKAMCHEGGCGACVVSVRLTHPVTKEKHVIAVNSCLVNILSCHDWDITTVEGVGNRRVGYHAIQKRLAAFNGTQCGYCTSGWVMNMYSLSKGADKKLTTQKVEDSFGGNICRCTGYRPILDAFKSFANDTDITEQGIQDLEDLHITKCATKCERKCSTSEEDWCVIEDTKSTLKQLSLVGGTWYKAYTIQDVFKVLSRKDVGSYRLVAGNTGKGVYPIKDDAKVLIDISSIDTMKESLHDENLILGAGMPLTEVMRTFKEWSGRKDFEYLEVLHRHLDLVAHVPVRNLGTVGGNLALKNQHHDFPSDVFLLFETVGATTTIVSNNFNKAEVKLHEFLKMDLNNKIILDVKLPPLSANNLMQTYKIMPRSQNAHAIVNAGFRYRLNSSKTIQLCDIVYGNIGPTFIHAGNTEKNLLGKNPFDDGTLQEALSTLSDELVPVDLPPEPSALCRKTLALGLFYKGILSLAPTLNPRYQSGGLLLERGVSRGMQNYETDKQLWPLNQPVAKLEALAQCSGEAKYVCDIFTEPRAVHVAFVLSTICRGLILEFDATQALKEPGVVSFLTAKDIPGANSFLSTSVPWVGGDEEILASKNVLYYGQPIGLIAAINRKVALKAAQMVKVKYKKSGEMPVLDIKQALLAPDKERRIRKEVAIVPTSRGSDVQHVISGSFAVPSQYHYTMETQSCSTSVTENGLVVRSATQWMDLINVAVAKCLGIDENKVLVEVPRVGGGYGGKASRSSLVACACSIVAHKLNRTATLVMPLTDNMAAIGKRHRCEFEYEVGVNSDGIIQYLNANSYSECGSSFNDAPGSDIASNMTNLYKSDTWKITGYSVLTDKACDTWCRAPATTEGIAFAEHIMERISHTTGKDQIDVRISNLSPEHDALTDMINDFKTETQFDERLNQTQTYNARNAWKKKSLKMSLMSYPISYSWNFPVTISVYHSDGTIAISHGGIEMGQGINTKIAQVCAYTLKVPLEKVVVRGSDSFVSPNAMASNGSLTSDSVAFATVKACEELLRRLQTVKNEMEEPTWEDLIKKAYEKGINLQASYMKSPADDLVGYNVYGVCCAEVELDVLTGTHVVRRLDILEDTGVSMSPEIDVGQIEGAFVMGLGLWTSEHLVFDQTTGKLLTDRTWTYKPPGAKDIPVDFRITFRRNSPNPSGVLRSKATGEPALTLAVVVTHALHQAILEARREFGYKDEKWVSVDTPYNVENILKAISPKIEYYKIM